MARVLSASSLDVHQDGHKRLHRNACHVPSLPSILVASQLHPQFVVYKCEIEGFINLVPLLKKKEPFSKCLQFNLTLGCPATEADKPMGSKDDMT